ncbi:MAG: urease accessory protein UreG, partial [Bauldia sp.]|nr:urease accessory protein UreG [Bauldia sp.]
LASTFSLDLVDWWMFVIDVAQGDDIPRKRGPGILQCDLLVINKTDLAPYVGVDAESILAEATAVRGGRATIACQCRGDSGNAGLRAVAAVIGEDVLFRKAEAAS